jgi:hypothetical protein
MATEFKILRGNKANLVDEYGSCLLPREKLVNGYWYLTNDTAEVFVCLNSDPTDANSELVLKKINELNAFDSFDPKVEFVSTYGNLPSMNPEVDTLYIVNDENASYRWTGSNWVCVGRDYNEIQVIFGGDADPTND